jgi:hypothetical protein
MQDCFLCFVGQATALRWGGLWLLMCCIRTLNCLSGPNRPPLVNSDRCCAIAFFLSPSGDVVVRMPSFWLDAYPPPRESGCSMQFATLRGRQPVHIANPPARPYPIGHHHQRIAQQGGGSSHSAQTTCPTSRFGPMTILCHPSIPCGRDRCPTDDVPSVAAACGCRLSPS